MTLQTPFPSPRLPREIDPILQPVEMRMILVAGSDAPSMRDASMRLFHAGHMPVMGEWLSEPLVAVSGLEGSGSESFERILDPLHQRLLARCDAVLRVDGPSATGDAIVGLARDRGLRVYFSLTEAIDG
jgi:hypothetical protein